MLITMIWVRLAGIVVAFCWAVHRAEGENILEHSTSREVRMQETVMVQVSLPAGTYRAIEAVAYREHRTTAEMVAEAIERYIVRAGSNPLVGLFADEPELLDHVIARHSRNQMESKGVG